MILFHLGCWSMLSACPRSNGASATQDGDQVHGPSGSYRADASDDKRPEAFLHSVETSTVHSEGRCWSNLGPLDVAIQAGDDCLRAKNLGEFGVELLLQTKGEPTERVVGKSKIDNVVAFARLEDGAILVVASVRNLNGRLFELRSGAGDWSLSTLASLPGDVLRIGKDEHAGELILIAEDLERGARQTPPKQLRFRCDRVGRLRSETEMTDAEAIKWIWVARGEQR